MRKGDISLFRTLFAKYDGTIRVGIAGRFEIFCNVPTYLIPDIPTKDSPEKVKIF